MADGLFIDDFDWSGAGQATAVPPAGPPATEEPAPPPEAAEPPPPEPAPRRGRQRAEPPADLLPEAYRNFPGRKNTFKRPSGSVASIDDFDWGDAAPPATPAYNPKDDWAITRGAKAGYGGGASAMGGVVDLARISALPLEQQAAAMLELGKTPQAPDEVKLQVPGIEDVHGFGDALTWLGESAGQMAGSWAAAAVYGGLPGAAVGAGVGGTAGAAGAGVGALPGAAAGGVAGFGYGTVGAFGAMGVGGMFQDLLHDEGVQKGLADGTVSPAQITEWSMLGGAAIGALDAIPAAKFSGKFTKEAAKEMVKEGIIKGTLKQMAEEGLTEAVQGAISEIGQAAVGGDTNALERSLSVLNQGLAGAVGGAAPGAVGTVVENARIPEEPKDLNQEFQVDPATGKVTPSTRRTEYEIDYITGEAKPRVVKTPTEKGAEGAGQGTPGGFGTKAPPPTGAGARAGGAGGAGVEVVDPSGVSSDIGAALKPPTPPATPTAPGDEEFDQPEDDEYTTPAPVDPDVASAMKAGGAPQQQSQQAAGAQPAAPAAPEPDLFRTGESSYMPGAQPGVGTSVMRPPEEPVTPTPPAVAPETPAELPPAPETPAEPVNLELNPPAPPEADPRLERLASYASSIEPVWDPGLKQYSVARSDLEDVQNKLKQLAQQNDANGFNTFWDALDQTVQHAVGTWARSLRTPEIGPERQRAAPPAREETIAGQPEPPAPRARPRASVALPIETAEQRAAPAPAPVTRKTLRMTLQHYQNVLNAQGPAAAQALLEKATIRNAKTRRRLGKVTGAVPEGGLTVSYRSKKKPLSVEELLGKHHVETEVSTVEKQPEILLPEKTDRQRAIEQMRRHFKTGKQKRKAVQLGPLGFTEAEIGVLERAGMAQDGTMDAAEFGRFEASQRGAPVKETGKPLTEEELPDKRVPYIDVTPKEKKFEIERAKAAKAVEEIPYERGPTGQLQGRKNIYRQGKKVGRASQLRQEVEHELAKRVSEEAGDEAPAKTAAEEIRRAQARQDIVEAREAAAAKAASEVAKGKKSAPLQLASKANIEKAVNRAVELFNKGEQTRQQAREAVLAEQRVLEAEQLQRAQELHAEHLAEEQAEGPYQAVKRTGKFKGKESVAIQKQDDNTTREQAKKEVKKPEAEQNPWLVKMAKIFEEKLKPLTKAQSKVGVSQRALHWAQIHALKKQWVAEVRAREVEQAKQDRLQAAADKRAAATAGKVMDKLVAAGLFSAEEARDMLAEQNAGQRYKAKLARQRKSTPAISRAIKANPLPTTTLYLTKGPVKAYGPKGALQPVGKGKPWYEQIREWGNALVAHAERELNKANVKLPERRNRYFMTPEENAVHFIKSMLARSKGGSDEKANFAMSLNDVWLVGHTLEQRFTDTGRRRRSAVEVEQDLRNNTDQITGLLFDVEAEPITGIQFGKTKPALDEQGEKAGSAEQQALDNRQFEVWREEQHAPETQMSREMRRWLSEHPEFKSDFEAGHIAEEDIFGSPDQAPEGLPLGEHPKKLTGAEAIDKYVTGSRAMDGVPPWQRWIRKYVTRHMKELVGDTPVYVVDPSVIASFSESGQQRGGQFLLRTGQNQRNVILLNRNLFGAPKQLANTVFHEMTHAATAHALANNIRGTRDVVNALMAALKKQVDVADLPERSRYALSKPEEFVSAGLEAGEFQEMMASLKPDLKTRAMVRALGQGRAMPTYWDLFVSMVQNAIGAFTPGRAGQSYLDQVLKIYPHVAMSNREQMDEARAQMQRGEEESGNKVFDAPFDFGSYKSFGERALKAVLQPGVLRKAHHALIEPTENLDARVADTYFDGSFDNPFHDRKTLFTTKRRRIEDEMRPGDQALNDISRWMREDLLQRAPELGEAHEGILDMALDGVDGRVPFADNKWVWHDALHPTRRKRKEATFKHVRDTYKRAAYERAAQVWDKVPEALKPMLSRWIDHMKAMMVKHDRTLIGNWLGMLRDKDNNPITLPSGMSEDEAIDQIYDGEVSDELKAALGDNAETIIAIGRFGTRGQVYAPAARAGEYFISGRRDIATPTGATFDRGEFDKTGKFRFVFKDRDQMAAYLNRMGGSGEERVLRVLRRWVDPRSGETVPWDFHEFDDKGKDTVAEARYYVQMQDRFMTMADTAEELAAMRDEMLASGEYKHVSDPVVLSQLRNQSGSMTPLSVNKMLHNIDSMAGVDAEQKIFAKQMVTTSFIQSQQGNRITKKLMRRQGVHGYQTGADELIKSGRTNNEMMARTIVGLQMLPEEKAADRALDDVVEAMRRTDAKRTAEALARLPSHIRDIVQRNMGKDDGLLVGRFSEDIGELNKRIENARQPLGGKKRGEDLTNAMSTLATLKYLGDASYHFINSLGVAMQTYPAMVAFMVRTEGVAGASMSAFRYLSKAGARVQWKGNIGRGAREALAEAGYFVQGFKPRQGWKQGGRQQRRPFDTVADVKQRILAAGGPYAEEMAELIEDARLNNLIGQAGLDQHNLHADTMGPGLKNKTYRGIHAMARVSTAMSEAIEINNRAIPMLAYYEYLRDKGVDHEQAKAIAMNRMAREQTGYAKENWPSWIGGRAVGMVMMFRKFGIVQALNYYGSIAKLGSSDPEIRKMALVHVGLLTAMGVALGGLSGNPLWEPARLLGYLLTWLFGVEFPDKSKIEKWMASGIGDTAAETLMYGLPRLAGMDLSGRLAQDNLLFFQQPKEMSNDEWYKVAGRTVLGPMGDMVFSSAGAVKDFGSDETWPKWLQELPVPKQIKDILNAYDLSANGPRTTTGIKTAKPPPFVDSVIQSLGFRTRQQSRPFEQGSAYQYAEKGRIITKRHELTNRVLNQGYTADNMRRIREWNRAHPHKDERISIKSITQSRKRRRDIEKEIRKQNVE